MITYGYIVASQPNQMGGYEMQVRIPSVHGAYNLEDYRGQTPRNYVQDKDLPWYPCLESVTNRTTGSIAVLAAINYSNNSFIVIGTTGSSYVVGGVDN